jgi:hypothetical protein
MEGGGAARTVTLKATRGSAMSANDQLTALDATFLELEQADDSALMHIGGALVFDPLPGGGTPAVGEVRERLEQRLDVASLSAEARRASHRRTRLALVGARSAL